MPFAFVLPTTSSFSFSTFSCSSHPSLLRNAATYRGVVRDTLKKHKRLPPESQAANLTLVVSSLRAYLPHLLAIVDGRVAVEGPASAADLPEWRPTLAGSALPGREAPRVRVRSLVEELAFVLATLGHAQTLQARAALQPLYRTTAVVPVGPQQRLAAITAATRYLLAAASALGYAAGQAERSVSSACPDISSSILRAHAALALAEATLLAVLKDDPYPAVVAQDRSHNDREWMYKAPDIPKVRAHLFARLCLAAADHAAEAHAGAAAVASSPYVRYLEDLRCTSRAKACRFFALDAELGGQTGTALAWLRAARDEVGTAGGADDKGRLLSRLRKEHSEKREDRRVERGLNWGADAGRLEETRVLEMLDAKWTKQNDTMNTQRIPPSAPLLAQMPSGREVHTVKAFEPPSLDAAELEAMRTPPDPLDEVPVNDSSDDEAGPSGRVYF